MIETNDLSKQFNDFVAVDGVNLSVGSGQILALLGRTVQARRPPSAC
jgi:ABC-type multidrug transport system ATPase subunit